MGAARNPKMFSFVCRVHRTKNETTKLWRQFLCDGSREGSLYYYYNCTNNNNYSASKRSSSSKRGHKYCSFVNKWLKNRKRKQNANGKWKTQIVENAQRMAYKTLSSLPMYHREGATLFISLSLTVPLSLGYFLGKHEWAGGPPSVQRSKVVVFVLLWYHLPVTLSFLHNIFQTVTTRQVAATRVQTEAYWGAPGTATATTTTLTRTGIIQ